MPGHRRAEATPFFKRLCAAMTNERPEPSQALLPHQDQRIGTVRNAPPLRVVVGLEVPDIALGRLQEQFAALEPPHRRRESRHQRIAFRLQKDLRSFPAGFGVGQGQPADRICRSRAPSTSRRSLIDGFRQRACGREVLQEDRCPRLSRRPSKMPLSTSVKSMTGCPVPSCSRTMSPRPFTLHAAMSLVNGSASRRSPVRVRASSLAAIDRSSSVTTQVLLRSVVDNSHCPIMSFFRATARPAPRHSTDS